MALAPITGFRALDGLVERLGIGPDHGSDVGLGDVPAVGGVDSPGRGREAHE